MPLVVSELSERWNCNKSAQLGSRMGQLVGLIVELSKELYLFKKNTWQLCLNLLRYKHNDKNPNIGETNEH